MPWTSGEVSADRGTINFPKMLGQENGHFPAKEFVGWVIEHVLDSGIDEKDAAMFVDRKDDVGGGFGYDAKQITV